MNPADIGTAAVGAGILVASVWNGWQSVQAKREAKAAGAHASTAADNSKPVSNGFTAHVRTQLADIAAIATEGRDAALRAEAKADKVDDKLDRHLEAHANGTVGGTLRAVESAR